MIDDEDRDEQVQADRRVQHPQEARPVEARAAAARRLGGGGAHIAPSREARAAERR